MDPRLKQMALLPWLKHKGFRASRHPRYDEPILTALSTVMTA
jgi:hypothetical protein